MDKDIDHYAVIDLPPGASRQKIKRKRDHIDRIEEKCKRKKIPYDPEKLEKMKRSCLALLSCDGRKNKKQRQTKPQEETQEEDNSDTEPEIQPLLEKQRQTESHKETQEKGKSDMQPEQKAQDNPERIKWRADGMVHMTVELRKICAKDVRQNTDATGLEWYSVLDFMNKVCTGMDKEKVRNHWSHLITKHKQSKFIKGFTRKNDFRYESLYSPSAAGLGKQGETPAVTLWGLQKILTIDHDRIGDEFKYLVNLANLDFIPVDASSPEQAK